MDGNVIFMFSMHKGVHSNNMMEALTIKEAMERACSLGWRKMVGESNSQIVVDMINNQSVDDYNWKIAFIVREILHLSSLLDWISFCHIPRDGMEWLISWQNGHQGKELVGIFQVERIFC